ncbi:helix-turn-helix transcriptional regulator [Vibrio lentus]|uniref:Transcriptional regulator n=1 Tax=Vibrio lentus TaxID=136468 RepID=A0A2J6UCS0_9VIBR|nr:helix-turn-helix transcriptional regulator [Vibrio lentus]MCB5358246.1 helix-turn-helix transcriptional regulator [Vibrio lentus]MCB5448715.1 helix-turn-helix transcriptional regulator [Vibrio lentus]MCB5460602.1 helix-turn-helix transcriptional regulator [Vibrio lentus]MCC4795459.1 helix-turn-helix domain-containing protein [Vibrio lentus]MCC4838640.1 helix-turn-helix domain-containing protein [Vibrio lentus]
MDTLNREICSVVKRHLKKTGISYKEVSEFTEMSEVSIKRLLNGHQSLSILKLQKICELIQRPLSAILSEAEESLASTSLFTDEQDAAFCEEPALFTIFQEIVNEGANAQQLMARFDLNKPSLHIYLRKLEQLKLIAMLFDLKFHVIVPSNTAFSEHARFSATFKNQVIDALKQAVQYINADNKQAYFITTKFRLTEEEFKDYNLKLEKLMLKTVKLSQSRSRMTEGLNDYAIVDMGAKGIFHPTLKKPVNLV